ncbi:hypothetical protein ACGFNU_38230 [Spirillospora sp. NPDC048911]|uniref:hypothetical protein n=1 Tax=Spirillospora sp. NPDC048911 TaxID=3364527 RepID=UPI00371A216B
MAVLLYRLGRWAFRWRRYVALLWVAVVGIPVLAKMGLAAAAAIVVAVVVALTVIAYQTGLVQPGPPVGP